MATKQFCDVCGKEVDGPTFVIVPGAPEGYDQRFYKAKAYLAFGKPVLVRRNLNAYSLSTELDICWPCVRDAIDKAYPRGEK